MVDLGFWRFGAPAARRRPKVRHRNFVGDEGEALRASL